MSFCGILRCFPHVFFRGSDQKICGHFFLKSCIRLLISIFLPQSSILNDSKCLIFVLFPGKYDGILVMPGNHTKQLFSGNRSHFLFRMGIGNKAYFFAGDGKASVKACYGADVIVIAAFKIWEHGGSDLVIVADNACTGLVDPHDKISDIAAKQFFCFRRKPDHIIVAYDGTHADNGVHITRIAVYSLGIVAFEDTADAAVPFAYHFLRGSVAAIIIIRNNILSL